MGNFGLWNDIPDTRGLSSSMPNASGRVERGTKDNPVSDQNEAKRLACEFGHPVWCEFQGELIKINSSGDPVDQ